jgi:alpha-mannosidase
MPLERHRRRLVQLMDALLDLFDRDPAFRHFHMDGQMVPIEDYLAIRPDQEARVRAAAASGRLSVGPWYVLQDEFLTSAEAQVRNLQIGMRMAREFAEPLLIGYLPDSFGNIGQMPQILRGFGITNAVFGRGINRWDRNAPEEAGPELRGFRSELVWEAPDGSEVLGVFFANWYANAMVIPTNESCVPAVERIRDAALRYATTSHLLLMNGCDHTPCQPDVSRAIALANDSLRDDRLVHSNFRDYVAAVAAEAKGLQRARGELRSRYTDGWGTLTNVLSSRLYQKQANWRCQTVLEKWAEPFSAIAWAHGGRYDADFLDYAWKLLLQNHPHDSICGCSADEVHREMDTRFAKAEQVAEDIARDALAHVAAKVDTAQLEPGPETPDHPPQCLSNVAFVVVFNPTNIARCEAIEIAADFADGTTVADVHVTDETGAPTESVLLGVERTWDYYLPEVGFRVPYHAARARVLLLADVPPLGYATYAVRALPHARSSDDAVGDFGNDLLRVAIGEDGRLDVTDVRTATTFSGLHALVDSLDVGDEYNYRAPERDEEVRLVDVRIRPVEHSPLRQRYEVRGRLPVSDGALSVSSILTLARGHHALEVATTIVNGKEDHRVRALFEANVAATFASADGQFEVVRRAIVPWEGWQNPSDCHPAQAYVDVSDDRHGLTIANRGLPEYEVLRDGKATLALTLLRCTGRIGDWGVFPTHDSQCLGTHRAEYAIIPHGGTLEASGAHLAARLYNAPMRALQTGRHGGPLPARRRFLGLDPARLVLSAVKKCDARDSLIIRFYNPFETPTEATLGFSFPVAEAYRARLDETREEPLDAHDDALRIGVPGFKIVTLEIVPRGR